MSTISMVSAVAPILITLIYSRVQIYGLSRQLQRAEEKANFWLVQLLQNVPNYRLR